MLHSNPQQCKFTIKKVNNAFIYLLIHHPHPAIKQITFLAASRGPRCDKTNYFPLIISLNENTEDQIDLYNKQLQSSIKKLQTQHVSIGFAVHETEMKEEDISQFVIVSKKIRENIRNNMIAFPDTRSIIETRGHIKIIGQYDAVNPLVLEACCPDSPHTFRKGIESLQLQLRMGYYVNREIWNERNNDREKELLTELKVRLSPEIEKLFKSYPPPTPQKQPQAAGTNQQASANTSNNNEPIITPHQNQGKDQDKNTPSGNAVESRLRKHKLARFIDRLGFLKEIEALIADKAKQDIPNNLSFCEALEALVDDLNKDLLRQEDALEKQAQKIGKNPDYSTLEQTTAGKIAARTLAMLQALKKETAPAAKLDIIRRYENDCKATPGWLKFAKGLAMVCFAAVGFVMGAVIGMGIGIAVGAWSGPGAFVTAALGAVQGAAIGVMAAASLVGLGAAIVSGLVLFKALPSVSKATELARVSENLLLPAI